MSPIAWEDLLAEESAPSTPAAAPASISPAALAARIEANAELAALLAQQRKLESEFQQLIEGPRVDDEPHERSLGANRRRVAATAFAKGRRDRKHEGVRKRERAVEVERAVESLRKRERAGEAASVRKLAVEPPRKADRVVEAVRARREDLRDELLHAEVEPRPKASPKLGLDPVEETRVRPAARRARALELSKWLVERDDRRQALRWVRQGRALLERVRRPKALLVELERELEVVMDEAGQSERDPMVVLQERHEQACARAEAKRAEERSAARREERSAARREERSAARREERSLERFGGRGE
jgi:hypothetical protein